MHGLIRQALFQDQINNEQKIKCDPPRENGH